MPKFTPDKAFSAGEVGRFTPDRTPSSRKKKKKGKSLFGGIINAAGDVRDIAVGAGPAVIEASKAAAGDAAQAVEDTVRRVTGDDPDQRITKPGEPGRRLKKLAGDVKQGYVDMYGPLFKGDFDKFLDNLYNDPVYFGLDVLTIGSGATKIVVRVKPSLRKGGRNHVVYVTPSGEEISKPLARGELRAQLQAQSLKIRPEQRAAKIKQKQLARKDANVRAQNMDFERSLRKSKSRPAKIAAALRGRFDRQALDEWVEILRADAAKSPKSPAALTLRLVTDPKVQGLFDSPTPQVEKVLDEARKLGEKQRGLLKIAPEQADARKFLPARIAGGAKWDDKAGEWVGGPSVEQLKGRGLDPTYFPDTSKIPRKGFTVGRGGGTGLPNKTENQRQNKGVLLAAGQLILDPATLNESFLRSAKWAHYNDVHESLLGMAHKVDRLPTGWTYIRAKRSDSMPHMDKSISDFEEWVASNLDKNDQMAPTGWLEGSEKAGFLSRNKGDAMMTEDGKYLAVPGSVARKMAGEFTRQNQFFYWMNRNPMRVWRALVLGLRPAYLVNNMIGNTLMYLIHDPKQAAGLAAAFKQFVKKDKHGAVDELLEKRFAGQVRGGFIASQMPEFTPTGKAQSLKKGAAAVVGVIPWLDKRWEQALRREKTIRELKKHPGLKDHATRMGRDTKFFEDIDPILEKNPHIQTAVYERVNDALGDYDSMSAAERGAIRNVFPFYAWYKAISIISFKLTLEQPLKVNLLARLGQVAIENNMEKAGFNRDEIPSSLLGFIPKKKEGDRVRGFNTSSVNPYATVGQLSDFGVSPLKGAGAMGRTLPGANPFLTDLTSFIFGQTPAGYGTPDIPGMGTMESIPQWRLAAAFERTFGVDIPGVKPAPDGDTFNDRDFWDELLRYAGVPYARVSPSAAKRVTGQ